MTLNEFIQLNNIQQADAIVVKRKTLGMLNHYVVFLGYDIHTWKPLFAANYNKGVQIITDDELYSFLQEMEPRQIIKFIGNDYERQLAIDRAFSKMGERSYDLIFNNCEHYASYVQTGTPYSSQSENFQKGLFVVGGMALIGLLVSAFASDE